MQRPMPKRPTLRPRMRPSPPAVSLAHAPAAPRRTQRARTRRAPRTARPPRTSGTSRTPRPARTPRPTAGNESDAQYGRGCCGGSRLEGLHGEAQVSHGLPIRLHDHIAQVLVRGDDATRLADRFVVERALDACEIARRRLVQHASEPDRGE